MRTAKRTGWKRERLQHHAATIYHHSDGVCTPFQRCCCTRSNSRSQDGPPADMEEAFKVMHLNGLIKMAVKLVRGLELEIGEDHFDMAVCSVVSWFKVSQQTCFRSFNIVLGRWCACSGLSLLHSSGRTCRQHIERSVGPLLHTTYLPVHCTIAYLLKVTQFPRSGPNCIAGMLSSLYWCFPSI